MIWDVLLLTKLADELTPALTGCVVGGLRQLDAKTFMIEFEGATKSEKLVTDLTPGFPYLQLDSTRKGGDIDLGWLHKLGQFILSGKVISIQPRPYATSLELKLARGANELSIFFELDQRFPNLILTDEQGKILVCQRSTTTRHREVYTGVLYQQPYRPGAINADSTDRASWSSVLEEQPDQREAAEALFRTVRGLSRALAREIIASPGLPPTILVQDLTNHQRQTIAEAGIALMRKRSPYTWLYLPKQNATSERIVSALELTSFKDWQVIRCATVSEAIGRVPFAESRPDKLTQLKTQALQTLESSIAYHQARVRALEQEMVRCQTHDDYRLKGEIIFNNIGRLRRGDAEVLGLNYRVNPPEEIRIELDPTKTPAEFANQLFSEASRLKRGIAVCEDRLTNETRLLEHLIGLLESIPSLTEITALKSLVSKFTAERSTRSSVSSFENMEHLPYRKFILSGTWIVLVGRSGKDNLKLLQRYTKPDDLWLHIRGYAGSHVVVKNPLRKTLPPKEVIMRAAELAAFFSKAAKGSYLPVIYTPRKYVVPVRGSSSGAVTCQREEVVFVDPRPPEPDEAVESLRGN